MNTRNMLLGALLLSLSQPLLAGWFEASATANVRAAPGMQYDVVAQAAAGDRLQVTERRGRWFAVTVERTGKVGWVHASLVREVQETMESAQPPVAAVDEEPLRALPAGFEALRIEMKARDAEVLFRKDPFDKSPFPVVLVDGESRHSGRVEVMGSFTRRFAKKSILIKLEPGQEWRGQRRIALDAMATDPSRMREWLAWDTVHALGMTAPEVAYTRLLVNGRPVGLFLRTEWVDGAMFARQGLGADGQFFHPNDSSFCGDLSAASAERIQDCWFKLSPRDGDFAALLQLSQLVADTPIDRFDQVLDQHFDAESVINWLALNVLTSNGDTYNKNYFLYRPTGDGRWRVVPWDYDLSFGRNFDSFLEFPASVHNDAFVYYYPPQLGAPSPLKEKLLRNGQTRERLFRRIAHLMGLEREGDMPAFGLWAPGAMERRLVELQATLRGEAVYERYMKQSADQFDREAEAVRHYVLARWLYLRNTLFGSYPWDPELVIWDIGQIPPPPPLPQQLHISRPADSAGNAFLVDDGYGYVLALLRGVGADRELHFTAESELARAPRELPPGFAAGQCIQRTWYVTLKTPAEGVRGQLTLEYLQENSRRNELGQWVDEAALSLWTLGADGWQRLPTLANPHANTLTVADLALPPARQLRFVACGERPAELGR